MTTILPKDNAAAAAAAEKDASSADSSGRPEQLPVARIEINLMLRLLEDNSIIEQRQNEALDQLLCLLQVNF